MSYLNLVRRMIIQGRARQRFFIAIISASVLLSTGNGVAQDSGGPVTAPKIGDIGGCPGDDCQIVIGDSKGQYPVVHVLSESQMPPKEFRKANFFSSIKQALQHVQDGGTLYIHTGIYNEELILKSPRSITIAAYGNDDVRLQPSGACLLYQPWFQEEQSEPEITLKGLALEPRQLAEDEACITVTSNKFVLENVSIQMPASDKAIAIYVQQGELTLSDTHLLADSGAKSVTGIVIEPTSRATLGLTSVTGFSIGIDVAGGLVVEDNSAIMSNGIGMLVSTEEALNPNQNSVILRNSLVATESPRGAIGSSPDGEDKAEPKRYGVEFTGRFASSALIDNVVFEGRGKQSAGVVVSEGAIGNVTVQGSAFDGFAEAASVNGSIVLDGNNFGSQVPMSDGNSNTLAINLYSRYLDTRYEVKNNSFLYNDYSFRISETFNGELIVTDNKGKVKSRGKRKYNVVESFLPKQANLMFCQIGGESDIEDELLERSKLGRIDACRR